MKVFSNFLKKLSKILILILIGLFVWFCSFNIKLIQKGREQTFDLVSNNSYESSNEKFYLEFINKELLFYKYIEKKNEIYSVTSMFTIDDGLLIVDSFDKEYDQLNLLFLSDDKLYVIELNQLLYLK